MIWQDDCLTDQNDKDVWIMLDPLTGEVAFLSEAYRKRLKEVRQERLAAGEAGQADDA